MNSIASEAYNRQRIIKYSKKQGVTKASIRYRVSRQSIYKWQKRYDGRWESLIDRSHRPHSHPREHTPEEYDMIRRYYGYYKHDKIRMGDVLRRKGYKRCYKSMLRAIKRMQLEKPPYKRKGRKPKPYQRAEYPGQKVQIDVKYVPSECVINGRKYYQYTAIDECTRYCFREIYEEHSTYSSKDFLYKLIKRMPFAIREIQTDNGSEFTNALLVKDKQTKSLFESALEAMEIKYHRIRVATPRHNGKVERQHRIDGIRFYSRMKMYSLQDGRKQIAVYNRLSNRISKTCLNYRSPESVLIDYLAIM